MPCVVFASKSGAVEPRRSDIFAGAGAAASCADDAVEEVDSVFCRLDAVASECTASGAGCLSEFVDASFTCV